jgi:acyl dehydratase
MKYWEDFKIGERAELGRHTFTEAEVVAFGEQYDPQPFHTVGMRLMVEGYINQTVSLGSPGIDNIRWLKPVRPGDTLAYTRIVLESRASATRKGVGLVKHRWEAVNQRGELVLTMEGWGMFGRQD